MAKKAAGKKHVPVKEGKPGTNYEPRDLMKTDPNKEQFAPTEEYQIPQHKRMGGVC